MLSSRFIKKNDIYTAESRYAWMLTRTEHVVSSISPPSWSWIRKLKLPEKIKFLLWLACHNLIPTLSLLNHRNISHSAVCNRFGIHNETFSIVFEIALTQNPCGIIPVLLILTSSRRCYRFDQEWGDGFLLLLLCIDNLADFEE